MSRVSHLLKRTSKSQFKCAPIHLLVFSTEQVLAACFNKQNLRTRDKACRLSAPSSGLSAIKLAPEKHQRQAYPPFMCWVARTSAPCHGHVLHATHVCSMLRKCAAYYARVIYAKAMYGSQVRAPCERHLFRDHVVQVAGTKSPCSS